MTTKVKPTVEKWVESIKQTCFDCIDYDGETVTWQSVLDKYLTEIVSEIKAHSVQEAKAERDREWIEALGKYLYDLMPFDGSGKKPDWVIGGNSLKQDEARRDAINILSASLKQEEGL